MTVIRSAPDLLASALRPLPLAPLQLLLSMMLDAIVQQHPRIFDRLGAHASRRFGIDPIDMPFAIALEPRPEAPRITALRRLPEETLDARISGPLAGLCGLVAGTLDGDALFFSRDLVIEGDVEAILALRNALDDAGIDPIGVTEARLGAIGPVIGHLARTLGAVLAPLTGARGWN